jgi:two-component system, NarL family, response regulator DevR
MTRQAGTVAVADRAQATAQGAVSDYSPLSSLTHQERTVLDLIAQGLTNREIAAAMFLSEKTVKNYVTRMLLKCNVRNRTEAAILVLQSSTGGRDVNGPESD